MLRIASIFNKNHIFFDHTSEVYNLDRLPGYKGFVLNPGMNDSERYSLIPEQHLISSNFESMTAIQTLNFFRYLDEIKDKHSKEDNDTINDIYKKIADLNDQDLVKFLTGLHRKATDTAEFNFYGAYKINLELIESIRYIPDGIKGLIDKVSAPLPTPVPAEVIIRPAELIHSLNQGDLTLYNEVKHKMPFLLESKRFADFLRSNVHNPEGLKALDEEYSPELCTIL